MSARNIYRNGTYAERHPLYHIEDSPWKARQVLKMVRRHNLTPEVVCDVGCGAGEVLRQLQKELPFVRGFYGYDVSQEAIRLAKPRENEQLHYCCGDFLTKHADSCELVLCLDVIEHIEDYMGFLRRLKRKGKYKIFHIPLAISVQSVLRVTPITNSRARDGHLHYFTKETALAALRDAGYSVVDEFYTPVRLDRYDTLRSKLIKLPTWVLFKLCSDFSVRALGGYGLLVLTR